MEYRPTCPKCKSQNVIPIKYGLPPNDEWLEPARRGEFVWGGCCINKNSPQWICKDCKKTFGKIMYPFDENPLLSLFHKLTFGIFDF